MNHFSLFREECSKSTRDRCRTKQTTGSRKQPSLPFPIHQCGHEMSPEHLRTPDGSQGRTGLSGTVASGSARGWNIFLIQQEDASGWKPGNIRGPTFPTQLTESLLPRPLHFSGHKQSDALFSPPDPYTKPLPGDCCSRNIVQVFDLTPDHWLKVTTASASHRGFSSPEPEQHFPYLLSFQHKCFKTHTHTHTNRPWRWLTRD